MRIERLTAINEKTVESFSRLIPQLVGRDDFPSLNELENIIKSDNIHLLVAIEEDEILGSLAVAMYHIPTGKKAIIEDVVVDAQARGKGVASKLMQRAIEAARENGARKIELTSNPTRVAANNLYVKLGFKVRDTNFYRLDL